MPYQDCKICKDTQFDHWWCRCDYALDLCEYTQDNDEYLDDSWDEIMYKPLLRTDIYLPEYNPKTQQMDSLRMRVPVRTARSRSFRHKTNSTKH